MLAYVLISNERNAYVVVVEAILKSILLPLDVVVAVDLLISLGGLVPLRLNISFAPHPCSVKDQPSHLDCEAQLVSSRDYGSSPWPEFDVSKSRCYEQKIPRLARPSASSANYCSCSSAPSTSAKVISKIKVEPKIHTVLQYCSPPLLFRQKRYCMFRNVLRA
jgi:hypothetical protein